LRRVTVWFAALAVCLDGKLCAGRAGRDSIAQRAQACVGCHGKEGVQPPMATTRASRATGGLPLQPVAEFSRWPAPYALMTTLLQPLTDDYLHEIASHFLFARVAVPAATTVGSGHPASLAHGKALVTQGDAARHIPACTQCHGKALTAWRPPFPACSACRRTTSTPSSVPGRPVAACSGARLHGPGGQAAVARRRERAHPVAVDQPLPASTQPAASLPSALPIRCGGVPAGSTGQAMKRLLTLLLVIAGWRSRWWR